MIILVLLDYLFGFNDNIDCAPCAVFAFFEEGGVDGATAQGIDGDAPSVGIPTTCRPVTL
jgi:hypothetical protein